MTTALVFDFGGKRVRTAGTSEAPLFHATDVCAVLGYADVAQACSKLEQDEQELVRADHGIGGKPAIHVTISGLFALILRSRKSEAKAFRKWVTSEVLPAIQRHGYFSFAEAQNAKQTELLLAEIFPGLAGRAKPIFRGLIASFPPWARSLASMVYGWAIPVDGQQAHRRSKNAKPNGSHIDHSMLSGPALEHLKRVVETGCAIARSTGSYDMWKLQMERAYGTKPLQLPFLVPMLHVVPGGKGNN